MHSLLTRPHGLGALEYVARLALGPLVLLLIGIGFTRGWSHTWTPAALVLADILLGVRWRDFRPVQKLGKAPGGSLGPLTKLVMVGSLLVAPLEAAGGEYVYALAVAVLGIASAGLWLGWVWASWAWIAYAIVAMAAWVGDLIALVYEASRSPEGLPISRWNPLLGNLPTVLFAGAVLTWVLEWRRLRRATGALVPPTSNAPETSVDPPPAAS